MIVVSLACVLLAAFGIAAKTVKPSIIYSYRFTATKMPADDVGLENWLRNQPGIVRAFANRKANVVRVDFIVSRDLLGNPANPDLQQGFSLLGYHGEGEYIP
jgi:hypothetical protein